jgi:hypothetical protein
MRAIDDRHSYEDWMNDTASDVENDPVCEHCNGDGMDPQCDYLLPCPLCQCEQTGATK